ncbi:tRNA (adenosine(37)-N6)-threonylcarbamoyltransferase complex transferase subunit TsaD [Hugonella massiliensis]|uniref:tRNA (adenosine(37)-N6)-threonylcarbamoyltransferase complex transferase subunit TsaD n=1 Tax=Hugonella massiliensis TaxID=1720315 RepID=UPI00073E9726|nr:tRNA (adenosine(37)-N6)-threonylcarbamoyltransferase complex transferase subunit TsaD [Hugonella massiliensis]
MAHTHRILAFDTANEVIALGLGELDPATRTVTCVESLRIPAHRASNTMLLPAIDDLLARRGIGRSSIDAVACGRGPGSFTGVRICIATAKGIASALGAPLIGVSTLDAVAWQLQKGGARGEALVVADAMRKEVYPVRYRLSDEGAVRLEPDRVVKAVEEAAALPVNDALLIAGDALTKYVDLFAHAGALAPEDAWTPEGAGLLACVQAAWRAGDVDPFDARRHDPALVLPVYTRLSDAEENERTRLASHDARDLRTGVQHAGSATIDHAGGIEYRPLDAAHAEDVGAMEAAVMGSDAWSVSSVLDDLPRKDRTWWAAFDGEALVGYAGGWIVDGQLQILKVACDPAYRRLGIARTLLAQLASDARDLGATECTLEVRVSNAGAQGLYRALHLRDVGTRPRYYSDGEDALIMTGPLPLASHDVAGMELIVDQAAREDESSPLALAGLARPLVIAIESSCDETAAALIDGNGTILADTVASQIDFHSRFGGVVPEIASRKHIEAICGVTQVCFETAAAHLGIDQLDWGDVDAVACTYAPGLVGALVVGVAFAKAAAWAADVPFIRVNHLEGHLYANKIAAPDIEPPMVVSLVSGGHTMLVHVRDWGDYRVLGTTIDDAVGEAFDKVSKALGLGYPGGPIISKLAATGNPKAVRFPRAMMHSGDLRFSLSGLKTAVITYIHQQQEAGVELNLPDIAASFQAAVIDVQVAKAERALDQTGAREFCLGGGVAANPALRAAYEAVCAKRGVRLTMPPASACTDNAAMIALVAIDRYHAGKFAGLDCDACAHTDLEEPY